MKAEVVRAPLTERIATALAVYRDARMAAILALGFSSGLPIMLVAATLSARLAEAGTSKAAIGLFAYVLAPYSFKFAWAPFVDRMPLPPLTTRLGRRRGWMLAAQIGLLVSIWALGQADPARDPGTVALAAIAVAFFSATQDVAVDAFRIEILERERLAAGAGVVVLGYRIGMWVATAGALFLAEWYGWSFAYGVMAALVVVGMVAVLLVREPPEPADDPLPAADPPAFARLRDWLRRAVVEPFRDFFARHGLTAAVLVLALVSLFKASDVLLTLMANPFYIETGFTKAQIAWVSKTFGLWMTLVGGLVGGALAFRLGLMRAMVSAVVAMAASNLAFLLLARADDLGAGALGADPAAFATVKLALFHLVIAVENLAGGLGTAVFVAFLSALCNVHYTATQYALLTSFMQVVGKFAIVPASGFLADALGWQAFFLASALFAVPALALLYALSRLGFAVEAAASSTGSSARSPSR